MSNPFRIKSPLATALNTPTVSADNRLNPEYLRPFTSFGAEMARISFSGTLSIGMSGIAVRYLLIMDLLISAYRYRFRDALSHRCPFFCLNELPILYLSLFFGDLEVFWVIDRHFNPEVVSLVIHLDLVLIDLEFDSVSLMPVS